MGKSLGRRRGVGDRRGLRGCPGAGVSGGKALSTAFAAAALLALPVAHAQGQGGSAAAEPGREVGSQPVPLPTQPQDTPWPTVAWPQGDLPPGARETVAAEADALFGSTASDPMGETRALLIVHRGRIVYERYRDGFGPETPQISWSMAKSVTQALVGRALATGVLDTVDAPMPTPHAKDDPRARITWRQWLRMVDGLDYTELEATSTLTNDVALMMYGPGRLDTAAYAASLPLRHEPGTHWVYSTAGLHLVGRALQVALAATDCPAGETCLASPAETVAWADRVLFDPLGMEATLEFDAAGTFQGGSLVWTSARDYARFGLLYLRDGVWAGERLLPEGWVDEARTGAPDDNHNVYGSGFWITPTDGAATYPGQAPTTPPFDAFSAQGHRGQTLWLVPSRDLIVVRLALMPDAEGNWPALYEINQRIARAFPPVQPAADARPVDAPSIPGADMETP